MATPTYVRRLGLAHFAHLRAVAEGLPVEDAAARYLAADTRPAARTMHAEVVQLLRATLRRRGDRRWRLIGLAIATPTGQRPTLEEWADARGLDIGEWGERELIEQYEADCPPDRRAARAVRLRERQLALLRELEPVAAEPARPSDLIAGWFDEVTAERLKRAGCLRLDELQQRIARGGRWYRAVPAMGATKAARVAAYLARLLPTKAEPTPVESYACLLAPPPAPGGAPASPAVRPLPAELDGRAGTNRVPAAVAGVQARHDREAIEAWLVAKAGVQGQDGYVASTAKSYRLEAERLLLWCIAERRKPLSSMTAEDCAAYKAFLAAIPEAWMSRRRAVRYGPGWTPFAGQLSLASQQHALTVVGSLFRWLVAAHYLRANPWALVKTRLGDDPRHSALHSRAFTPAAWDAIVAYVVSQPASPTQARALFLLHFNEGAGLRAAELVGAELGHFGWVGDGWAMQVHGKGARHRVVAVPPQSVRALNQYLACRGLPPLGEAPPHLPLVASTADPRAPVGYRTLYDSMRSWVRRAIVASSLPSAERDVALRASLHWLRHTCGTRALERDMQLPELQAQFGHADPRTTMRYSKVQLRRRQAAVSKAFA